jgi:hypothetical protein
MGGAIQTMWPRFVGQTCALEETVVDAYAKLRAILPLELDRLLFDDYHTLMCSLDVPEGGT